MGTLGQPNKPSSAQTAAVVKAKAPVDDPIQNDSIAQQSAVVKAKAPVADPPPATTVANFFSKEAESRIGAMSPTDIAAAIGSTETSDMAARQYRHLGQMAHRKRNTAAGGKYRPDPAIRAAWLKRGLDPEEVQLKQLIDEVFRKLMGFNIKQN